MQPIDGGIIGRYNEIAGTGRLPEIKKKLISFMNANAQTHTQLFMTCSHLLQAIDNESLGEYEPDDPELLYLGGVLALFAD